jgi:hypothetical protein
MALRVTTAGESHGPGLVAVVPERQPRHAIAFSCATPIKTTPKRPSRSAASTWRRATCSLDSPLAKRTTGIALSSAKRSIACT